MTRLPPILAGLTLLATTAPVMAAQQVSRAPIEILVPDAPHPMVALGRSHLAYEVHLTNFGTDSLTLLGLVVFGDAADRPIDAVPGEALPGRMTLVGAPAERPTTRLAPGQRAVVYLWTSLPPGQRAPASVTTA